MESALLLPCTRPCAQCYVGAVPTVAIAPVPIGRYVKRILPVTCAAYFELGTYLYIDPYVSALRALRLRRKRMSYVPACMT